MSGAKRIPFISYGVLHYRNVSGQRGRHQSTVGLPRSLWQAPEWNRSRHNSGRRDRSYADGDDDSKRHAACPASTGEQIRHQDERQRIDTRTKWFAGFCRKSRLRNLRKNLPIPISAHRPSQISHGEKTVYLPGDFHL